MAILEIFDQTTTAVARNERGLLHEQFVARMALQDRLAREHYVDCLYNDDSWETIVCSTCGRPRQGAR